VPRRGEEEEAEKIEPLQHRRSGSSMASKNVDREGDDEAGHDNDEEEQCQERTSVIQPPRVGPTVGARLLRRPSVAG